MREAIELGDILALWWTPACNQLADGLTKANGNRLLLQRAISGWIRCGGSVEVSAESSAFAAHHSLHLGALRPPVFLPREQRRALFGLIWRKTAHLSCRLRWIVDPHIMV